MNKDIIPHNDVLNMLELSILVYNYGKDFSLKTMNILIHLYQILRVLN